MTTPKRWIMPAALALAAFALLVVAATQRYETHVVSARTVIRTDRLTGAVERCRATAMSTELDCTTSDDEAAALRELEQLADSATAIDSALVDIRRGGP